MLASAGTPGSQALGPKASSARSLDYSTGVAETSSAPIVGVFHEHLRARDAILALEAAGVDPDAISVLARSAREASSLEGETGASGDLEGDTRTNRVHDVLDWLASIGGNLPGFSPVAGTGNLGLEVARSGTERGAVTGALVGCGVPVDEAAEYEQAVVDGRILVVVHGPAADPAAARAALTSG
jgi:hypothetical protein